MKKFSVILLTIVFLAFSWVFSTPVFADGATSLRIWFSQYDEENLAMEAIAKRYEEETGVHVEVISRINLFNAVKDLVNNATLDDRPDIVYLQAPDIGLLVKSGYLRDISDAIDEEMTTRFVDVAFSAFSYNGSNYGVGYSVDSYGLIYNKAYISEEELPKTWDEFYATAKALTQVDEDGNVLVHGALLNSRDMWFNYSLIKSFGGYYYGTFPNGDYNPYDIGLDNPGMLDYIALMKEMKSNNLVLTNKIHGESEIVSRFANGKVAMIIYGLWYASSFQQQGIDYGIASLPDSSDGTISKALATVTGFAVNNYTLHPDESVSFLKYILEDDNQQLLIEAGNGYSQLLGTRNPANKSVIASAYIQSSDILSSLSSLNDECEPFPNIAEGQIWYNYTSTVFQSIFFGDANGDEVDPQAKLSELTEKIREDVQLMNYQAERIEVPPVFYLVLILLAIGFIVFKIVRFKIEQKKQLYHSRLSWKETFLAWGLMTPLLILLLVFYVYPICHNFYLSLTDYSGVNLRDYGLIGFANYKNIFVAGLDGLIKMSCWTIIFATLVVVIAFILGTFLATLLCEINFKVAKIYRIVFILPWVIPTVITLLMWQGLLDTDGGLINQLLGLIGIPNIPWLSDAFMAKVSTVLVMTWFSFPYFMVVASGLLKSIPKDYYDAAKMDGANGYYTFKFITLPLVFKALIPTLIMSFIMQFNQFGVYILTAGGPASDKIGAPGATDLLITYVFNTAFNTSRYAVAASYSVIIFVFVAIFAIISMRVGRKVANT
ncbi:MAG: extracellular solute-binding protein [Candidatus Izemoplasmatales bacterium]|nr:extracellular solute-binding protein [Candidatus Izemoplasmatales bacterium]